MTDSRTRIPSPARSVGALMTPRRHKNPRKTRSVCSPARSNASGRLSALIQEHKDSNVGSFKMSPLVRRSVLPDNTEIDEPGNASWWRNLNDESRDVMEVLKDNAIQPHNIMEELNIEVLSQEEKRYTLDIPDSSDSESINSIIIPQRKFFHEKENHPQKQFEQFGTRETLDKLHKSNAAAANKTVTAGTKELFQAQPRTKPVFPAALLDISTNTSASEKTLVAALRPKAGIRNLLGNVQATKRKNMFAKFIESDTEDEISDIPEAPKILFDVQKLGPVRRPSARSSSSKLRDHSPTSNVTSDSFADWDHLPSSTMVDNQLEAVMTGGQKAKRSKLSKLSEADSTSTKSDKTKQSDKSALTVDPKFQTITIEKSLQQNTYIVTKNHSTVTQETEGQLNDSQEAQNKSHLSPRNISQTSMTTRSKNKSVLSKVPKVSLNKSRNASIKTKNTSNTPKKIDNTVNKSITKKDSVTKNVSVTDADENELNEPDQNNDDELHFSLEYESDDNADEVNVAEKSKYISSKNESVTNNAKQKKDISNASNNLQNTVNKVVEESGEISDNHHKSRLSSQNDEQNENEKNVYNHMDVDETENMSPNKIVEKEVINKNKATDKEPQNVQRKSIEKRNISANVSQIKGSVVDKKGAEIQNKTQNEGIEIQNTSVNTNEKNMESQNEILNEKSLITQDKDHHKSDIEGDNNDINEQSQNIVPERDEKNEEEQDESKSNKEENAEFENDQNYTIEKQSEIEHDGDELNKSEEQRDETEKENESQEEQIKSQDSSQNEIEEDSNEEQDEKENDAEKNECDEEIEAEEQYSTQKELNESRDDNPANTQSESEDSNRDMEDEDRNISNEDANESVEEATAESDQEVESDQEQENNESHQEVESDQEQENNESHQEVESDQEQENNESHQEVETDQEQENNESHGEVESGQEHENSESHQEVESDQEQENNESHQEVETDQEQENNESHREVESDQEHENSESHREVESGKEQENNDSNQELESDQDVNDQSDDNNQIDNTKTPNVSHDTTGRNRIKNPKRTLEVGLFNKSRDQDQTFVGSAQNTSIRKTKSIVHPNIAQVKSISLVASGENSKESLRLSGPGNSSAEGSGWDSHRTTRKTLRQTFGKDFTPRKSLRAMVMEKSAKRHTLAKDTDTTSAVPIANSTEFGDPSMDHGDYEMNDEPEESVHEVSLRTRKAKLEEYLQKIRKDITEENAKIVASVTRQLEQKPKNPVNPFQVPARPMFPRRGISKPKPKTKKPILHPVPLESLPKEFLQDIKYKPPKRFCPRNAPWLTKHFYKYVETKLEPKYDYKARVRAEKFAQTLHGFVQDNRRRDEVSADAVEALKREMARLNIVQTHSDFYNFFWDFMPKEVQLKRKGHSNQLQDYEKVKNTIIKKRTHAEISSSGSGSESAVTCKKFKQSTITNVASSSRSINFDKLIVKFIVDTMSPVSIVEQKSFKALIEGAQQLTKPPKIMCRRTAVNKISNEYNEFKNKLKKDLNPVEFVCSTADIWSSSKRSYLGVTVHWIDCNTFERNSAAIACKRFKGAHTYDKVAEMIADIHSDHDLKLSKIVKTVTDNGSNMVKAFDVFGKSDSETVENQLDSHPYEQDLEETSLDENNDDDDSLLVLQAFPDALTDFDSDCLLPGHERCATHTLHLIASTDFKQARSKNSFYKKLHDVALAKCQALWNLCSRSPKACETYLEMTGKSPTSPCATRWNSYYNSIRDLLAVQNRLSETMKILKLPPLKENELNFLSEYVDCSKPIAEAIQSLQGEKDTYYGCLLPELLRIQHIIKSLRMENLKYCSSLLDVIEENLNRRFKKFLQLEPAANDAILASVSHPFFKMKWVPKAKKEYVKELILTETRKINRNEKQKLEAVNNIEGDTKKKSKDESYYMFLEDSDSSIASGETTGSTGSTADLETLQYLNSKDTNIQSLNAYPTIKKIFFKYNTCLPSSAPVERLFSFGGMIMRPHRRKMSDKMFEELVLLKSQLNS